MDVINKVDLGLLKIFNLVRVVFRDINAEVHKVQFIYILAGIDKLTCGSMKCLCAERGV